MEYLVEENQQQEKKKKKKKNKIGLSKESVNIIRTTQRNNIDLTQLADNKANVLLSLNAIMITFLMPLVFPHFDIIVEKALYIPLIIFTITCFSTILISAIILKPATFDRFREINKAGERASPFFFGNFYHMNRNEFFIFLKETLDEQDSMKRYIAEDLFFVGKRLAFKMTWIRRAFNIFLTGMFLTILSTGIVLCF